MNNIYNTILLFLSSFILAIYGYKTNLSLDDVKKLKVSTCSSDKDCKNDYELKCLIEEGQKEGHCISKLFCHPGNDKCVFEVISDTNDKDNGDYVSYESIDTSDPPLILGEGIQPTLILESCNRNETEHKNCYTRECLNNSECFSGVCENKICITEESNSLYVCSNDINNFQGLTSDEVNKFKTDHLTCRLAEQENCVRDSDCITGTCQTLNDNAICVAYYNKRYRLFCEAVIILLFIIAFLIGLNACSKRKNNKVKKDLKIKYEMEEAFLNHSTKDYVELEDIDEYDVDYLGKTYKNNKL